MKQLCNPFHATGFVLYPLKASENQSEIFCSFYGVQKDTSGMKTAKQIFYRVQHSYMLVPHDAQNFCLKIF